MDQNEKIKEFQNLIKSAEAGDVVAKIALDSLLSSPLHSPDKK